MNVQDTADYLFAEMTKLDAPISYSASLVMAKHILASDIDRNVLLTKIVSEALRYAGHYPEASDGRNTFVLFAQWIEGMRADVGTVGVRNEGR